MKRNTFLLGVLAALACPLVTAPGAAASAKVCSTSILSTESPAVACKSGHGTVYSGSISAGGTSVLTATNSGGATVTTVTCKSTYAGSVNGTTGTGTITKLTFTECSSPSCPNGVTASSNITKENTWASTVTTERAFTENTNGIVDVRAALANTDPTLSFDCNVFGIHTICSHRTASFAMSLSGSDVSPRLIATNAAFWYDGGPESLCGAKADWSATYDSSVAPSSMFIE